MFLKQSSTYGLNRYILNCYNVSGSYFVIVTVEQFFCFRCLNHSALECTPLKSWGACVISIPEIMSDSEYFLWNTNSRHGGELRSTQVPMTDYISSTTFFPVITSQNIRYHSQIVRNHGQSTEITAECGRKRDVAPFIFFSLSITHNNPRAMDKPTFNLSPRVDCKYWKLTLRIKFSQKFSCLLMYIYILYSVGLLILTSLINDDTPPVSAIVIGSFEI